MKEGIPRKVELIIAGTGGQGVLMGGLLMARAAMLEYQHVSWTPSYGHRVRSGNSECTVIFSNDSIDSPLLSKAEALILIDPVLWQTYKSRVRQNGVIVCESSGLSVKVESEGIRVLPVAAREMAISLGDARVSNMILLGVYIEVIKAISPEAIEKGLEERFGARKDVISLNIGAFRQGLSVGTRL